MSQDKHKEFTFSVTIHSEEYALISSMRGLAFYCQGEISKQISWGNTKEKDWAKAGRKARFILVVRIIGIILSTRHKIYSAIVCGELKVFRPTMTPRDLPVKCNKYVIANEKSRRIAQRLLYFNRKS